MATQRTGGMKVIGILNYVFGGLGCLFSLLMVLGGGAFALFGSAIEEAAAAEGRSTEGLAEAAATGGGMFVLLGLVGMVLGVLLIIAGVGVMKVRPWGRTCSLAYAGSKIIMGVGAVIIGGFGFVTIMGFVYPVVLGVLFTRPAWKAAFCSGESTVETPASEEHRAAA
ncbi:MAG: hypothetical protein IH983_01440 [Planctomycetes bacterium]|nr:hypothetical protein [Planctomycetota bacterium]